MKSVLLMMLSVAAFGDDYIGTKSAIKVEINANLRNFQYCEVKKENSAPVCRDLGAAKWYSLEELAEIKDSERTEAYLKTAGAIIGVAAFWYFAIPAVTAGAVTSGSGVLFVAAGGTSPLWFKKTNPIRQFKQANVLSEDLIMDHEVTGLDDKELAKIAELLDEILN